MSKKTPIDLGAAVEARLDLIPFVAGLRLEDVNEDECAVLGEGTSSSFTQGVRLNEVVAVFLDHWGRDRSHGHYSFSVFEQNDGCWRQVGSRIEDLDGAVVRALRALAERALLNLGEGHACELPRRETPRADESIEHKVCLKLSSGADLTLLYFSDHEARWIFSYDYVGEKRTPGVAPDVVNKTRLTADYAAGVLKPELVLSMHVIVPSRLGREFFVGLDISPGAKTYLEFTYKHTGDVPGEYVLVEICKGARERIQLDRTAPGLVRPVAFPFPVPDRIAVIFEEIRVPFLTNAGTIDYFNLPWSTVR